MCTDPFLVQAPQLPNLAQAALQRLAAAGRIVSGDGEGDSPDDFRPLKKRRITEAVSESDDEQEVGFSLFPAWVYFYSVIDSW